MAERKRSVCVSAEARFPSGRDVPVDVVAWAMAVQDRKVAEQKADFQDLRWSGPGEGKQV